MRTMIMAAVLICSSAVQAAQRTPVKILKKAEKAIVEGINYSLDAKNNKAKVIAGKNLYTGNLVIPEKFTEDSVTYYVEEIDGGAFKDCPTLTSVTIPSTVTKIGSSAFEDCTGIVSISIPETIPELPSGLFAGCTSLKILVK